MAHDQRSRGTSVRSYSSSNRSGSGSSIGIAGTSASPTSPDSHHHNNSADHRPQTPSSQPNQLTTTSIQHPRRPLRSNTKVPNELFHSFAEGMSGSLQSLRRKAFERKHSTREQRVGSDSAVGITQPIAQFRVRDQPSKMIIPPPYGQEEVQAAAKALAAGIPDGIPHSDIKDIPVALEPHSVSASDLESASSDEDPEVRVHLEIHVQEDAKSEPICPLNEKNLATLTEELGLSPKERLDVEAIQTKEELATYLEKIPRDYDVRLVASTKEPEFLNGDSFAVIKEKLFYDLLFVANLTDFTHSHPITGSGALGHYIGWFVIMWWAWAGQTFWAARFDMDDLFTKVTMLIEFCALISFGAFSVDHLDRTSTGFIGSYIVLKGVLAIEYGNGKRISFTGLEKNRSKKSLTPLWLQIGSNVLAMLIWGLSMLVHSMAWRYVMWYFTIVVEIIVLVAFGRRTSVTFAGSHLPERFALISLIIGLGAGTSSWTRGTSPFLILFLLTTVILYALWWIYFDDFSEDVFHKTTTLSQLWAYLHLPFHVCALDLIRLYKLENHITEMTIGSSHLTSNAAAARFIPNKTIFALGFEIPIERRSAAGASGPGSLLERATDYDLTRYFLVVCGLFLTFTPWRAFPRQFESWLRRELERPIPSGGKGIGMNNSVTSLINPTGSPLTTTASYFPQQQQQQQQLQKPQEHQLQHQLSLQQQTSSLSQQQQQALYNMHVNANSLALLVPMIKRREHWAHPSGDGSTPIRQVSLRATERGIHSVPRNGSSTDGPHGSKMHIQRNSLSLNRPGIVGSISSLSSSPRSPSAGAGAGAGALKLATMFDQPLLPPQQQGKQSPSLSSTHVQLK
ncbi:bacterial low temperature requirement A protein-domain-containing protein [Lobosporangium transversale]|uniref:Bacterial low temperature requirement A protein-domain-containing protein n=1 Tax=Lobosporangium transversale TaxID=64571 RepID=A0A1Y2GH68_9FUNG|nr:bacterial low temperature requirement A protein-domain-containing protein [Lobosporangium transversale]ORZ10927.1 bacterial low temperature requirement A protein-domain-containing protein [Lobosporangium transversale]|eukprot:XP_021879444.1 bacterial low temperature requirement A protein-domain-containing protein [Lobosporangium transversale]